MFWFCVRTISFPNFFNFSAAAAWNAPLVVRRKAFLEVGGLSEEVCAGGNVCESSASVELSARLWDSGYAVGVHTLDPQIPLPCEYPPQMSALNGSFAAQVMSLDPRHTST